MHGLSSESWYERRKRERDRKYSNTRRPSRLLRFLRNRKNDGRKIRRGCNAAWSIGNSIWVMVLPTSHNRREARIHLPYVPLPPPPPPARVSVYRTYVSADVSNGRRGAVIYVNREGACRKNLPTRCLEYARRPASPLDFATFPRRDGSSNYFFNDRSREQRLFSLSRYLLPSLVLTVFNSLSDVPARKFYAEILNSSSFTWTVVCFFPLIANIN